ncbi:MAG: hypothetical protein IKZ99_02500 [Salinivirgaceae bacterium]|nr:hypothetical protein [Salinivirgaceae bacterium]
MKHLLRNLCLAAVVVSGFSACQSEDEMEDAILDGVCWEGTLPISEHHGAKNYSSRYYFVEVNGYGLGFDENYYKGVRDTTYEFQWYWWDERYSMLALNYGGRYGEDKCFINIRKVKHRYIYGWFYKSLEDYEYDTNNGSQRIRGTEVELKRVDDYGEEHLNQMIDDWTNGKASFIPMDPTDKRWKK